MIIKLETNTKPGFHKWNSCYYLITMTVKKERYIMLMEMTDVTTGLYSPAKC